MDRQTSVAARLKERVYVTFSALAVVLAMRTHVQSGGEAASTLGIAAVGTVLAMFVADVVSNIAVHAALPTRAAVIDAARVGFGALASVALPMILLLLATGGVMRVESALHASTFALVLALVGIGFLAVRRARLPWWQRVIVLLAEFILGVVVVGLGVIAHQ